MTMDKRERVARAIADAGDWLFEDAELYRMADAAIAALEPMDKPRVKPLVWTSKGYAETPFGKYHVVMEDWSGQDDFWFVCFAGKPYGKCGEHGSEEAAKAAAQADYEARILAAIEPVTVQEAAQILYNMPEEDRMRVWRATRDCPTGAEFGKWFCKGLRALAHKDAGNG